MGTASETETSSDYVATRIETELMEAAKRVEVGLNDFCLKLEDGRIAAERLLKRSRYAAEDAIDEATHQIKRNPLGSLAVAFAAGAALALLVPYVVTNGRKGY